jgi:transposase
LQREILQLVRSLAPTLLGLAGVAELTAGKIVAEVADVRRFRSKDAFARHNWTAPLPVWSSNRVRHRLSRRGNRQLNAAIHRIAITQKRCHADAKSYLERRWHSATPDGGAPCGEPETLRRRLPGPPPRRHAHRGGACRGGRLT